MQSYKVENTNEERKTMKKKIIIIAVVVILIVGGIIGLGKVFSNKKVESNLKTVDDIKTMFDSIYKDIDLPALETDEVEVNDDNVKAYTGLEDSIDVEKMVVSEPLMNAQAYSAVVVVLKDNADVESSKQKMLDNLDMRKWICVSAEQLYITNNGQVIFLVMGAADQAKPVYENFKKYVNNEIGKELVKGNQEDDISLPEERPMA